MGDGRISGDLSGIEFNVDINGLFTEDTFQNDLDQIFRKSWLPVGHDYDLPEPGSYRTRKIPGLNYNILLTRGKDGKIRAFHNICRHRGNLLVCTEQGKAQGFSCAYHGWTYNTDGAIRGVTDRGQFPPYPNAALGLIEIRCEIRHTFIFLNFDKHADSLDAWLGNLAAPQLYDGYFDNFRRTELITTTIDCNWNLVMDAFSEAYHTLFVHKNTASDYLGGDDNPMRHPFVELSQMHSRLATQSNPAHVWSPTETLAYSHTARAFPSFDPDTTGLPPGVNFGKLDSWAFDVIKFFPNFVMLIGRDWFIESYCWPVAANKTLYEWNMLLRNPKSYGERVAQEFSYILGREIACEDLFLIERQQSVLENGVMDKYFLSFQELIVAQHYRSRAHMSAKVAAQ